MPLRKAIVLGLILLCVPQSNWAESKVFVESYNYNAGEADSKLTCRTVSLLEVGGQKVALGEARDLSGNPN
jgi:hypothetical protein